MATTLTVVLTLRPKLTFVKDIGLFSPQLVLDKDLSQQLASGTDINESNQMYAGESTLAKNAAENIDLYGTLLNPAGDTVNLAKLKGITFHNLSVTPSDVLVIGGGGTNFKLFQNVTGRYELGPNGLFTIHEPSLAGKPVTAGSADLIRVENQGTQAITYEVIFYGTQ